MEVKDPKPKDVQVIQAIMKEMGIQDYENRVVNQLLEFAYRYVTIVLDDANVYSQFAKKKTIDSDDIKLAIQLQVDKVFSNPPPRDLLLEIARSKNAQPLPPIKSQSGTRLPPDRYSLTSCNYRLKSSSDILATQEQSASQFQASLRASSLLTGSRQSNQMQSSKSQQTANAKSNAINGSQSKSTLKSSDVVDAGGQIKRKLDETDE